MVGGYPEHREPDAPPPGLDWDRWLGPARVRPYNPDVHRGWYGYWDFSGGNASDAIHKLDLARIVLDDPPHPKAVGAWAVRYQMDDGGDMPNVQIVAFQFDRLVMSFVNTGFTPYHQKSPAGNPIGRQVALLAAERRPHRDLRHQADDVPRPPWRRLAGLRRRRQTGQPRTRATHPDKGHLPNFIDCIRSRKQPNGKIQQGHASACLEHLANIAYRTGNQRLLFDGKTETFVGSEAANGFLKPYYRDPYRVPERV